MTDLLLLDCLLQPKVELCVNLTMHQPPYAHPRHSQATEVDISKKGGMFLGEGELAAWGG